MLAIVLLAIVFAIATLFVTSEALSTITILISASNIAIAISIDVSNSTIAISIDVSNLAITKISLNFIIKNKVTIYNSCVKIKFVINEFSSL